MSLDAANSPTTYSTLAWMHVGNSLARRISLIQVFLITAGGQWGMLVLAYVFVTRGRENMSLTPELLAGSLTIFLTLVLLSIFRAGSLSSKTTLRVFAIFLLFLISCALGEFAGGHTDFRNLVSYAILFFYLVAGSGCGYFLCKESIDKQNDVLVLVFLGWYLGMLLLALNGNLSYSRVLTGASVPRLEFDGGYTATEIPIVLGQQLPFVLMMYLGPFGRRSKMYAGFLLVLILLILGLTASIGAIVASTLVAGLFFAHGSNIVKKRLLKMVALGLILASIFGGVYFRELYDSLIYKLVIDPEGSGRLLVYDQLVGFVKESPMTGIGKGQFQFYNNFGEGGVGLHPHNNLLGIAAELGLTAMIFYVLFIVAFLKASLRNVKRLMSSGLEMQAYLLLATAGVMIYQQARGFLHDTWTVKELYFWAGYGLGIMAAADRLVREPLVFRAHKIKAN